MLKKAKEKRETKEKESCRTCFFFIVDCIKMIGVGFMRKKEHKACKNYI